MLARAKCLAAVFAACIAALAFASAASASVTVGQLFTPSPTSCGAGTALAKGDPTGPSYVVPSAGVITSWSWDDGATTVPGLEFKVGRLVSGTGYKVVAASVAGAQTPNTVVTFSVHVPVQAGDLIGVFENGGACVGDATNFIYEWVDTINEPLNSTATYMELNNAAWPVSAQVEPDADGDGFGDETQDKCPTDASTQGTCPPPPPAKDTNPPSVSSSTTSAKLSNGGAISLLMTASEAATGTATGTISLPKSAKTVRFKRTKVTLAAGKLTKITLKLSKRNAQGVRRALKHHGLKAKITVTVKDTAGNQTVKKLTVKLTR